VFIFLNVCIHHFSFAAVPLFAATPAQALHKPSPGYPLQSGVISSCIFSLANTPFIHCYFKKMFLYYDFCIPTFASKTTEAA
jgi:hypothetical protein